MTQEKKLFSKAMAFILALVMILGFMPTAMISSANDSEDLSIPVADMLDVDFSDGKVVDHSPKARNFSNNAVDAGNIVFNDTLGKYVGEINKTNANVWKTAWPASDWTAVNKNITMETMFRLDNPVAESWMGLFGGMQSAGIGFDLYAGNATHAKLDISAHIGGAYRAPITGNEIKFGEWYHAVATYEGSMVKLYVNGELVDSVAYAGTITTPGSGAQWFCIGGDTTGSNTIEAPIDGAIALARVWSRALTAEQIKVLAELAMNTGEDDGIEYTAPLTRTYASNINDDGTVTVTVNFRNNSTTAYGKAVARLEMLGNAVVEGKNENTVKVAPGETETVSWTAKALTGSARLIVVSTVNGVTAEERVGKVTSKSAGWISGDTHDHSRNSDGSGTILQNFAVAKTAGMDFINISDHDNSRGWADAQVEGAKNNILPMWGNEYSGNGHAVFMNVEREFNYNSGRLPKEAVVLFKEHTNGRGLAYAAHPYDGTVSADPWGRNDSWNAAIDGIEVWNGWYASNYRANKQAREQWDKLNNEGRHLYGIADTDTHSADGMGAVYTTVLVDEYSIDGIIDGYKAGHMYGSNGPVIDFKIGGAMMGDDFEIPADGRNVNVNMSGYYISDLARVLLIKNGETVYTKDVNAKSFNETVQVFVKPGDFIRMEVEGVETATKKLTNGNYNNHSFFTSAPFAFSNPIFFVEGGETVDYIGRIPEELRNAVSAYFPFDGSYEDVTGNINAKYFNAENQTSYSVANAATSGASYVPGRDGGQAIKFGDGKYGVVNSSSNVDIGQVDYSNDFTISFWANNMFGASYGSYPVFFGNSNWNNTSGASADGILISTLTDTSIIMNVQATGVGRITPRPQSGVNSDWHYVTMTGNRTDGKFSLYIDGKLLIDGETDGSYPGSVGKSLQNVAPTRIGSDGYADYGYYGAISDFVIFDKTLSANEVGILLSAYTGEEFVPPLTKTHETVKNADGSATVTAIFTNDGTSARSVNAKLNIMGDGIITGGQKNIALEVPAKSSETISWTVRAVSGSVKLFLTTDETGKEETIRMGSVASGLAGWVSGDSHDHSLYSDGSGTIFQNFAQAQKQGIDYVTITDHSTSRGWADALIAGPQYGIIPIRGNEYSHSTYSHAVFINVNQEKNYSSLTPPVAVQTFKNDTNGEGLVYVAHPFDDGVDRWQQNNGWESPIDGIEVWNAWYAGRYIVNARAFEKWDLLNSQGRHLYGIATTDTHSSRYIGEAYTTVYVEEYTAEGILDGHRAGHMYGSNGPVIDFRLGNAMMGDDVGVSKDGEYVTLDISGEYFLPLTKVLLIKNGEVVYSKEINANSFDESVELFVKPGDFIRMEVEGTETETRKLNGPSFDTSAPFAFTNPIFFYEAELETYTVTFDYNDDITINVAIRVREDELIERPEDPEREGYVFLGWYKNESEYEFNFEQTIEEDITLTAKWEAVKISDAQFLMDIADSVLKNGLSNKNLVLAGKTAKLVFDDREIILSTEANNLNIDGEVALGDGYFLIFDIKGNGSNVKEFKVVYIV